MALGAKGRSVQIRYVKRWCARKVSACASHPCESQILNGSDISDVRHKRSLAGADTVFVAQVWLSSAITDIYASLQQLGQPST
jgi:hypothetical protein